MTQEVGLRVPGPCDRGSLVSLTPAEYACRTLDRYANNLECHGYVRVSR